jgi:cytidylate kinase
MIIAIDGTAGSGKGTLAKNLSSKLNLKHLDTGVLFRIIANQAIKFNISNNDKRLVDLCKKLTVDKVLETEICENKNLKSNIVSKKASEIALNTSIRNELMNFQRKYTEFDKSLYNGVILDGRDIGTVVFPNADYKFYLDANVKIRAKRRTQELIHLNYKVIYHEVLNDLILRDKQDTNRTVGPLLKAEDAILIDSSVKSEDEVLKEALKYIEIN